MSATVYPLQPTSAYQQNDTPICDDSDDDISLANIMTRKLQVNQQVMINNWTTSNYQYCYGDTIPVVGYQPFYNNQLINPQLIPYNNNNSNNIYQQQHYSRNSGRPRSSNLGANHRSSLQNTRSTPLNTHQSTKIRVSPPSTAPSATKKSKNYRQYSSSSSSSTSASVSSSLSNHPHRKHIHRDEINDCESQSSSTPSFTPPSLIDDNSTRRSSIYSLTSATTSYSATPSSDTITNHDHSPSPSSTTKKVTVKRSFSKKLKHVFTSSNNNKHQDSSQLQQQQHHHHHHQPVLRKTPSISSLSSVNTISSENNSSIRHSFVSLFRRPSKLSTHIEQEDNQQPSIETDSSSQLPKKNIKANNHKGHHYHHHHHHINDTPSVTSSTSETTTISNSSHNNQNHKQSLSKDGFDISHQNTTLPQITTSYLQHNSPMLRPSTNHHHHRNEGSVIYNDFNDDAISSIYAGSVHSYAKSTTSSTYNKKQRQQLRKQSFSSINHSSNNTTKVRFTKTVQVHETFSAKEYDRQCDDQTTCQTLTPIIALQIKQELNEYKLNEMEVHPHSRQYTHFFL
ncbi:hypothetical protein BJ944DRAFT_287932 [Cunninghamella echinulata]|nr:hypothetical protein BJ944DRAFT_287932 [Cunninghamella echinulata]